MFTDSQNTEPNPKRLYPKTFVLRFASEFTSQAQQRINNDTVKRRASAV